MSLLFPAARRVLLLGVLALSLLIPAAPAAAVGLDLEHLDGSEAAAMMERGELTSVELTQAYVDRIEALNQAGPGLNAVSQLNKDALKEAQHYDQLRAEGRSLGPAMGLPALVKDIIDVKGMATTAGNWSLRDSYPAADSGVAKRLREHGVVILGKANPDEFAAWFGANPSGFSDLGGQVLNPVDAELETSGSSSGNGAAAAAAMAPLTIGTDTAGSIIGPSLFMGLVGLRPTVGLVPGSGIAPLAASQDTAGPIVRSVADAALAMTAIAGQEPSEDTSGLWGPGVDDGLIIPPAPATVPDYLSALTADFVAGKRIGYTNTNPETVEAKEALEDAGAIMVYRPPLAPSPNPLELVPYEMARDQNLYYQHLGPEAPIKSLQEEVADNDANPHEALKFGNARRRASAEIDISPDSAASVEYRAKLVQGKVEGREAIDRMLENDTPGDPNDDFIAILDSLTAELIQPMRAGYPWMNIPMGYSANQRRPVNVLLVGAAYSERDLLGVGYAIEQRTKKLTPVGELNPSMYRCAKTAVPQPYAERGDCNPDYESTLALAGGAVPELSFSLEDETAAGLQDRMTGGSLSAVGLTEAYLARIAVANAAGPSVQAVRDLNPDALAEAAKLDAERASSGPRGPLHGIPVLLDSGVDAVGIASSGGSVALQGGTPEADSEIVTRLKAAGAIVLGKANVSELNGLFSSTMPEGYSSLGGQVLLPSATDKNSGGSSAGSAAATASGMAAMAVGMETSTSTAELVAPAAAAGLVGLKPTMGRVSRAGVMPVARSQDSPGPIARSVYDAALQLQAIAGPDDADPETEAAPPVGDYAGALDADALDGQTVAVVDNSGEAATTKAVYDEALDTFAGLGATLVTKTIAAPAANPVEAREFKRDLDAYLGGLSGGNAGSLAEVVAYNAANPVEGLKYSQDRLEAAAAVDLGDPAVAAEYESDREAGRAADRATIDALLADTDVIAVPEGSPLVTIADRAGYPVLTVPGGFGPTATNNGRNPVGVVFVAGAFEEEQLLAAGYAFEQATDARLVGPDYDPGAAGVQPLAQAGASGAPSWTNPSMWRCVPLSGFYSPHHCRPGSVDALVAPAPEAGPAPVTSPTAKARVRFGKVKRNPRAGTALIRVQVSGSGYLVAKSKTVRKVVRRPQAAKALWLPVRAKGGALRALRKSGHAKVGVRVVFRPAGGAKVVETRKLTLVLRGGGPAA